MSSGLISFFASFCGGVMGVKGKTDIPFKNRIKNNLIYQTVSTYFGVTPMKALIALIKKKLKEIF
jgi:hypothetical protein